MYSSAYELYADSSSGMVLVPATGMGIVRTSETMASRFKKTFSLKDVKVHFVGAW